MPTVELMLVGRLRVVVGGRELPAREVGTRKARLLLMRLAAGRGAAVPVDTLADAVWVDELPRSPADNLATLVSRLRTTLGTDVVVGDRSGWQLGPEVLVDLESAAAMTAQAEVAQARDEPAVAATAALAATRTLTGDVLADEPGAAWADEVRAEAAGVLRRARRVAVVASLQAGDAGTAVAVAADALRADPFDEAAVRMLMRAYRAAGEPARALAEYELLRERLADELGADPAPATRELHQELLTETEAPAAVDEDGPAGAHTAAAVGPRRLRLVGRDPELAQLLESWTAAVRGRPALLLVTGEPGIGKTRLVDELAQTARATGGTVLAARCYETERSLFLQPLVDALRPELLRSTPAGLRELAADRAAALAPLVPEVAAVLGPVPVERHSDETERRLAYEAVATVLRRLAARGPVLVLLDDLHNAGLATLEQLHLLARTSAAGERLLVVATLRTAEGSDALRRLDGVAGLLALGPLTDDAVHELAAGAGRPELAESIARRTRGHALSVVEMLRAMSEGVEGVPASLAAAVLARVGRLEPDEQELVRAACVLGSSFEPDVVAGLLAVPPAVVLRRSGALVGAGLVVEAGRSYEFANDLVQEVLYDSTPQPTRFAYHRLAMDLLADRPEAAAVHAAACGHPERAAQAWLAAGREAMRRFAVGDAERVLGRAVSAAQDSADPALMTATLLERALARETLGRYPEAMADLTAAHEICSGAGLDRLEMLVQRALGGDAPIALGRPLGSCTPHLDAGLQIARRLGDEAVAADLQARLAVIACNRLDFVSGRGHAEAAVASARASGDATALRLGLDGLKTTYAYLAQLPGLEAVVDELEPMVRRSGDLFLLQWLVFERAFVPLARGDWDAATALVDEALALNRRSGRLKYEGWFMAHLGWIAHLAGRHEEALGLGRRSLAAVPEDGHSWFDATACSMLAGTLASTGDPADRAQAVRLLRRALASADRSGAESYRLRALALLAELTRSEEDVVAADRMLSHGRFPDGTAWVHGVDAYVAIGRAYVDLGRPARAVEVVGALVAATDRHGSTALARAAGAHALLDRAGSGAGAGAGAHTRSDSRAASRSAPSEGTGT